MNTASNSAKRILFVHGRGPKPDKPTLQALWCDSIAGGIRRDHPDKLEALQNTHIDMFYFADKFAPFTESFNATVDLANRRLALEELTARDKPKLFRRKYYEEVPGKSSAKEFLVDAGASVGLGGLAIKKLAPEYEAYWAARTTWGADLLKEFCGWLQEHLNAADEVLLVTHCLGSILAYDGLWTLSQQALQQTSHESGEPKVLNSWITIGSPLASNAVRKQLCGAHDVAEQKYPRNILRWHNIAAEDDYICHDMTVADDYAAMLKQHLVSEINDYAIYNLAVRYGKSNPHSSMGYLIHPRTAELVANWLAK